MNILAVNTWFVTLIKQFFFSLDQVVFNYISEIYDLLISIARTSILTQTDISAMAEKIYALLTVFMVFKVTLSLITYVVNPDDFADKSKGLSKLGTNIIISLSLLVLTPYIFNYAFELQTIILEDNSLAKLIFETEDSGSSQAFINSAGDEIAYTAMSAFFTPNLSITKFQNCVDLENEDGSFNANCSGVKKNAEGTYEVDKGYNNGNTMAALTDNKGKFKEKDLINYVAGVENKNLGLMFRQDLAVATVKIDGEQEYIMEYKFVFSTVVGVVIILLLLTYCMDIALRSIKLSFLQLIAPIPILSYVDPKSGKDGLFKKWYDMCFKTYLSLFIRLLALYFAIYIIGRVGKMVDIVDGSSVTDIKIKIFVIIGALMFAKQLPKMLEGLGIKLDGGGKFTLNPLKKFEEGALGGKNITGMARGALVGTAGMLTGAGVGAGLSGAWRGLTSGKGWKETGKATAEMNRKMRQAKLDGSTFGGRLGSRFAAATGIMSQSENIAEKKNDIEKTQRQYDNDIKSIEDKISPTKTKIANQKRFSDAVKSMETRAKDEIQNGNSWVGKEYKIRKKNEEFMENNIGKAMEKTWEQRDVDYAEYRRNKAEKELKIAQAKGDAEAIRRTQKSLDEAKLRKKMAEDNLNKTTTINITADEAAWASSMVDDWLTDEGMKTYMTDATSGVIDDATFRNMRATAETAATAVDVELSKDGSKMHGQLGASKGEIGDLERSIFADEQEIEKIKLKKAKLGDDLRELTERERRAKADETAIK
jgi:hypothetical protein